MPKKIMVVLHEQLTLTQISHILRSAGYEVITSRSGLNALSRLETERPDMVLTIDTLTGEMNGLELAYKIKKEPATNPIIVFMLIEQWNMETIQAAIRAGAEGYEFKSPGYLMLIARIETTFQAHQLALPGS